MNNIKKASIITGAVVGGLIGGTISVIGKISNKKFVDELGESIIDSTILTGGIAGDIASGTTHVVSGKIKKNLRNVEEGKDELKSAGGQMVDNFVDNFKTIAANSGEIFDGIKEKDGQKVMRGAKTLAKVVAVGTITVGAIKVKSDSEKEDIYGIKDEL